MIDGESRSSVHDKLERGLDQVVRFLRFDAAVVYWYAPELNALWPLAQSGGIIERATPAIPGHRLIGEAFRSGVPIVADEATIESAGDTWLRAAGARSVLVLPLWTGTRMTGVVALMSRRSLDVDPGALRAVAILASQLTSIVQHVPFFPVAEIQRVQLGTLTGIIATAASSKVESQESIYELVAHSARLLTGAHVVAFSNQNWVDAFVDRHASPRRLRWRVSACTVPAAAAERFTVIDEVLANHRTLSLLWRGSFAPTSYQRGLVASIAHTWAALDSLRVRLVAVESERRALYMAAVSKALAISLDSAVVKRLIEELFVPAVADWTVAEIFAPDRRVEEPHDDAPKLNVLQRVLRDRPQANWPGIEEDGEEHLVRKRFEPPVDGLVELLMAPMVANGEVIGTIHFGREHARGYASIAECALYGDLTVLAAQAIANAVTFSKEHDIATLLQRSMLATPLPKDPRLLFDSVYVPAVAETQIGGDWYDVFPLDKDRYALSIGDVAGHGISAAITMNVVRLACRAAALSGAGPVDVLDRAEKVLDLEDDSPMVTALYGIVDLRRNVFTYACAGHCAPLIVRSDGTIDELYTAGIPLGINFLEERKLCEVALAPGDTLVLYTDGLLEYGHDILAGGERLNELLRGLIAQKPQLEAGQLQLPFAQALFARVFDKGSQQDDVAILTVSIPPSKKAAKLAEEPRDYGLLRL